MASSIKKVWLERSAKGFLLADARCVVTGGPHVIGANESREGMAFSCQRCKAGESVDKKTRADLRSDRVTETSDIRVACWMCGGEYSCPKTGDEYFEQACCQCLLSIEEAGLFKICDERTRVEARKRRFEFKV